MANHSKRKSATHTKGEKKAPSLIRIVAGQWRGRKIPVLDADGLRPTGDRVRETLFNWLQHDIPGSRCLDLFAGSGALGLEAASRGAASVTLVESSTAVLNQLEQTLHMLDAPDSVDVHRGSAEDFLSTRIDPFDIVFVDPPFSKQLHLQVLEALSNGYLAEDALIYVECPSAERGLVDALPPQLSLIKEKAFGDVTVFLLGNCAVS